MHLCGMEDSYAQTFDIRWGDLDPNRHLANTAIMGLMIETRMIFLRENGVGQKWFEEREIGPVILSESTWYLKEILPDERITIRLTCEGHSADDRFWRWGQTLFNQDGVPAVIHRVNFAWFDLAARKILASPPELKAICEKVPKSPHFAILPSSDFRPPVEILQSAKLI